MAQTKPQVGSVGLGQQGGPMAANLRAAGYRLTVRDADLERERRWVAEYGGSGCDGDPAALAGVEILVTMLPNGQVVRDALLGSDQIALSCSTPQSPVPRRSGRTHGGSRSWSEGTMTAPSTG